MSEGESIPIDTIPSKETAPSLQRNIEEDERFQSLLDEQNDLGAKLSALALFREKHPDDYEVYERDSIWYNDEGQPDVRLDLFYRKLDRDARMKETNSFWKLDLNIVIQIKHLLPWQKITKKSTSDPFKKNLVLIKLSSQKEPKNTKNLQQDTINTG